MSGAYRANGIIRKVNKLVISYVITSRANSSALSFALTPETDNFNFISREENHMKTADNSWAELECFVFGKKMLTF